MSLPSSHSLSTDSLLSTKLFIPQTRHLHAILARPRLIERLQSGLACKLTLISAPAGYGKTILLTEWISQSKLPVAWLSLDESDNDLTRFLTYCIAALQTVKADFGQAILVALQASQPPPVEGLMTSLVNAINHALNPCVLVLDDYHLLQLQAIHTAVTFLLNHQPANLHLILASRADPPLPLARLRVRGQLTELRAADLRFTLDEATAFFQQTKDLPLQAEQIKELEKRTEGWGAGLQLAALSLQKLDSEGITRFIGDFTGSHHDVFDYLAEEVLQQQPAEIQQFLLHTSILNRLSAPLCDVLLNQGAAEQRGEPRSALVAGRTVRSPASGLEALAYLEHANLFLVSLDDERRWYRYHHLFANFLRNRLRREIGLAQVNDLHRRASGWFEQHGLAPEAVQHALAADDCALAARLIEPLARPMQLRGEMATIMAWLAELPEDELRAHPQLGMIYAWGLATTGQVLAARRWLQHLEPGLAASDDPGSLLSEVMVIRARIALVQGDYQPAREWAHQALAHLPEDQLSLRALTHVSLGTACIGLGDLNTASQSLTQASTLYQALGQPIQALLPLRQLARVQLAQGRLNELAQTAKVALQFTATGEQRSPLVGYTYLSLGELYYERNDLAAAARYFTAGLTLVEQGDTSDVLNLLNLADAHLGLARLRQAQGDTQGALALLQRIEPGWEMLARTIQQRSSTEQGAPSARQPETADYRRGLAPIYLDRIAACRVQVWLRQGDVAAAQQWVQSRQWNPADEITILQENGLMALARVLIAAGETAPALPLLLRLADAFEAVGRMGRVIEVLALQALALQANGQEASALVALERALRVGEPEGYIRTFIDEGQPMATLLHAAHTHAIMPAYVAKLLAAFSPGEFMNLPQNEATAAASTRLTAESTPAFLSPIVNLPQATPLAMRTAGKATADTLVEPLSQRELEILTLLAQGLTNVEIGRQIYISDQTVKVHRRNIYGKLGVNSRRQAVTKARDLGLLA